MLGSDAVAPLREKVRALEDAAVAASERVQQYQTLVTEAEERAFSHIAAADVTAKARMLLEGYSEEEQEALRRRVEGLVGRGLSVIFGEGYGFEVEVGQMRGQAAMKFWVTTPSGKRDPLESHGGGVVNVVAFVLRVVVTALTPGLSRVLVLDEPFAQLSQEYLEPMGGFLRELVEATGIQLIVVSHEPEIAAIADKAFRFTKVGSVSQITET